MSHPYNKLLTDRVNGSDLKIDVCGESYGSHVIGTSFGYITSPGYPARYPPNTMCTCRLNVDSQSLNSQVNYFMIRLPFKALLKSSRLYTDLFKVQTVFS